MYSNCGLLTWFREPCRDGDEVCYDKCYFFGGGEVSKLSMDEATVEQTRDETCSANEYEIYGVCTPLTTCSAEEYEVTAASNTSDRVCAPLTTCSAGEYERRPPSTTSDRVCAPENTGCTAGDPGCQCYFRTPCRGSMGRNCRQHTSCYKNLPGNWRVDPWAPGFRKNVLTEDDAARCLSNARAPNLGRFGAWMNDCHENPMTGTRLAMSSKHANQQTVNFDGSATN